MKKWSKQYWYKCLIFLVVIIYFSLLIFFYLRKNELALLTLGVSSPVLIWLGSILFQKRKDRIFEKVEKLNRPHLRLQWYNTEKYPEEIVLQVVNIGKESADNVRFDKFILDFNGSNVSFEIKNITAISGNNGYTNINAKQIEMHPRPSSINDGESLKSYLKSKSPFEIKVVYADLTGKEFTEIFEASDKYNDGFRRIKPRE